MIPLVLAIAATGLLFARLSVLALYLRRLGGSAAREGVIGKPLVTLLRPVCGREPLDSETLRSSFQQDYPNFEVIFCAQSPEDPVIGLIRGLMAENPGVPARLLVGNDIVSINPKLNNVWKGWQAAAGDWICMSDSNLLLPADYLTTVVAAWEPGTGLVSSPLVGARPHNLAGHLECAFLNGNQAALQYAADSLGVGFAQGKTMLFNKPMLDDAGGLRRLGCRLAEDTAATLLMRRMGRKVTLTLLPYAQPIGRRTFAEVWHRQLRWSRVRRDAFPVLFATEIFNGGVPCNAFACLAVVLSNASPAICLGYVALWYLPEVMLARRAGWPLGWQGVGVFLLRDLLIPAVWLATFARRGFEWGGTTLESQSVAAPSFMGNDPV